MMRHLPFIRPLTLALSSAALLLGALACDTHVVNGVSAGGGSGTGGHPECTKNADCAGGQHICQRTQGRCVSLTSLLCTTIMSSSPDAYHDDNAVIFGSILPTVGPDAPYGVEQQDAIRLALAEFGKVGGLPSPTGPERRPIVVIGCNDGPNEDQTVAAAKYLTDELGVPAILGYSFSGGTISIATDVTIPAGVLLLSPSATSPAISTLADNDLVWRIAPSDLLQAPALVEYSPMVESAVRKRYGLAPGEAIKVAVVHNSDSYGAGLSEALEASLHFNGKSAKEQLGTSYQRFDYGSPTAPDLSKIAAIVSYAPHLTFLLGFSEGLDPVLKDIEAQWTAADHRSFFVLPDAGEVPWLLEQVITTEDLRTRVTGTVPGVNPNIYAPAATFAANWAASPYGMNGTSPDFGVPGAYDSLYLLAYSAVAVGADPLTGANLVKYGLRAMLPGAAAPKVVVGPAGINTAFQKLSARAPIDIVGVSGPLDFDEKGDVPSDIQIWCVPKGSGGQVAGPPINSSVEYDVTTGQIAGVYSPDCAYP